MLRQGTLALTFLVAVATAHFTKAYGMRPMFPFNNSQSPKFFSHFVGTTNIFFATAAANLTLLTIVEAKFRFQGIMVPPARIYNVEPATKSQTKAATEVVGLAGLDLGTWWFKS